MCVCLHQLVLPRVDSAIITAKERNTHTSHTDLAFFFCPTLSLLGTCSLTLPNSLHGFPPQFLLYIKKYLCVARPRVGEYRQAVEQSSLGQSPPEPALCRTIHILFRSPPLSSSFPLPFPSSRYRLKSNSDAPIPRRIDTSH